MRGRCKAGVASHSAKTVGFPKLTGAETPTLSSSIEPGRLTAPHRNLGAHSFVAKCALSIKYPRGPASELIFPMGHRWLCVAGLGRFGDLTDIPTLRSIATMDALGSDAIRAIAHLEQRHLSAS